MKEFLVFDENIITPSNKAAAEQFCQQNGLHLLQIGLDTVPSSVRCVFISANQQFISGLGLATVGFYIKNSPSAEELQEVLAQIKPQRKNSTNGLNGKSKKGHSADFFKSAQSGERQPLVSSNTEPKSESPSTNCCVIF